MIEHLELENFRSHEHTALDFAQANVFHGRLGSGKTSVLHALALLLTGQDAIVNARGEGRTSEIRHGAKGFRIVGKLGQLRIERKVTATTHTIGINDSYGDVKQSQGIILARLGQSAPEMILAQCDPTPIFQRDEKFQRKVLTQLMGSTAVEAPALVKELGLAERFTSAGAIDQLVKEIKEDKIRLLNREIETLQKRIPESAEFDAVAWRKLNDDIARLSGERDQALQAQAQRQEWERRRTALEERLRQVNEGGTLEAIRERAATLKEQEAHWNQEVERLAKVLDAAREEQTAAQAALAEAERGIEQYLALIDVLQGMGERCGVTPIFQCPLKPEEKAQQEKLIEAKLEESRESVERFKLAIGPLANVVAMTRKELQTAQSKLKEVWAERIALQRQEAERVERAKALEEHLKSRPAEVEGGAGLIEIEAELQRLTQDRETMQRQKDQAFNRSLQVSEVRAKQEQAEALHQAVVELERLKNDLLAQSAGSFLDEMREFLTAFGFHEVRFSNDPFGFYADDLAVAQLSGGQQLGIEAALRLAAARRSGFEVVALDSTSLMNPSERDRLGGLLVGSGVQIFVCSTVDQRPAGAAHNGVKRYWFESPGIWGPTTVKEF